MPSSHRSGSSRRRKLVGRRRLVLLPILLLAATIGISTLWAGVAPLRPVTGTNKGEVLRGSARADHMRGLAGNDRIYGYRGNDLLLGGLGADVLVGGLGTDRLYGGAGNDRINSRDGLRDRLYCGAGNDTVLRDARDVLARDCETGGVPPTQGPPTPPAPRPGHTVVLTDQAWQCRGPVDLDLVKVTMRTTVDDAVRLDQNCSGRVGRIEVETWTGDGIKIQNRGTVAHDLVIESGYVKCHAIYGEYHQDGLQAMGGARITLRGVRIDCLGNSNFFLSRGGSGASTPTDIVCEGCALGPNAGQTLFFAPSLRSGLRNSTICTGRFRAIRVEPGAEAMVNEGNKVLPRTHPSCANVTGRG
jgi:hypothetical protein